MDLQKISKNNHHMFTLHKKKTFFEEHTVVFQICDDLGWINYNYQMECLNGIIGENNANNKKINSFEKSYFVNITRSLFIHHLTYRRHKLEKLSKADHEMNTKS